MPLETLPRDKLVAMASLVSKSGDVALIESAPDGAMKQVTLIAWVRATPDTMYGVLANPGDYRKFFKNVSRSDWQPQPGGGVVTWKLDLPVSSFTQVNAYAFEADRVVTVRSVDDNDDATYRWELLAANGADGRVAGTVVVQYGYTDVKHSNGLVKSFIKKMPVTEHGLALAAQVMLLDNLRREAERRTQSSSLAATPVGSPPSFGFLLERGQVAVMRSGPGGVFSDLSLLDRWSAPIARVREVLSQPTAWPALVPGVSEVEMRQKDGARVGFRLTFSLPVPTVSWTSEWLLQIGERFVDGAALAGDLRGGRFRWDLTARGDKNTLVVYRVNQRLGDSSVIFRRLIQHDPSLEHGLNVAFSLVYLRGLRAEAER
jgi:hypothetical protein